MNNIFKKTSLGLMVLGLAFYFISTTGSITTLIPTVLGGIIYLLVFLSEMYPNQHRHFAHAILFILGVGVGATYKSVLAIFGYLVSGDALLRPLATIEQFTTFVLCLVAIIIGVQSFIEARKK
jgi:hypothetical protein